MRNQKRWNDGVAYLIGLWLGLGLALTGWGEEHRPLPSTTMPDRLDLQTLATGGTESKSSTNGTSEKGGRPAVVSPEEGDQLDLAVLGFASSPAIQVDTLNLQVLNGLKQCAPLPKSATATAVVTSAAGRHVARPAGGRNGVMGGVGAVMTASGRGGSVDDAPLRNGPVSGVSTSETPVLISPVSPSPPNVVPASLDPPATRNADGKGIWPAGTRFWWWGDRRYHDSPEPGTIYSLPNSSVIRCQNGQCYRVR